MRTYEFRLIDEEITEKAGSLKRIHEELSEFKDWWNTDRIHGFSSPRVLVEEFEENKGEKVRRRTVELDLKRTGSGWSGSTVSQGDHFGANLNPVRNRVGRWGVTVWIEPLSALKKRVG